MFTPEFWKNENKIGNALYRINQSQYKDYCEIDELFVFLAQEYPNKENCSKHYMLSMQSMLKNKLD